MINVTDNEIIKALKCCIQGDQCAYSCPYDDDGSDCNKCTSALAKDALDLINRQKAEIEEFKSMQKPTETSGYKIENGKVVFYTNILNGYRHEYKDLDEVVKNLNLMLSFNYNADDVIMHYKAKSELVDEQQAEIERLRNIVKADLLTAKEDFKLSLSDITKIRAEAIKEFADELFTKFAGHSDYHGDTIHCIIQCMAEGKTVDVAEPLDTSKIKSEAIKEFAEKLKENMQWCDIMTTATHAIIDNLVKEMVGDSDG